MKKWLFIAALAAASWLVYKQLSSSGIEKTALNPAVQLQQGEVAKDAAQRAMDKARDAAQKTTQGTGDAEQ